MVEYLFEEAASNHQQTDAMGRSSLEVAAHAGQLEIVTYLLSKIPTGQLKTTSHGDGSTALHWAAKEGHAAVLELLIHRGFDLDARNQSGRTALALAVGGQHVEATKVLCEHATSFDMSLIPLARTENLKQFLVCQFKAWGTVLHLPPPEIGDHLQRNHT